jgi:hypothetical protein
MSVPTSEVGYTSTTTGSGDHEVNKGHVVALEKNIVHVYHLLSSMVDFMHVETNFSEEISSANTIKIRVNYFICDVF